MNNLSRLLMSSALCTVCTVASAQQVNVNGIVKDATGETVIGASVMVKGTKTGTVTDFDGNFHVECAPTLHHFLRLSIVLHDGLAAPKNDKCCRITGYTVSCEQ